MAHYKLHQEGSTLVKLMNKKLQEESAQALVDFYEKDSQERNITYLIKARVRYPRHIQPELSDMVPTCSKRVVQLDELSAPQREIAATMSHQPSCRDPIMISDFSPQNVIVTISYLSILTRLGISLEAILTVMTAFSSNYFAKAMGRMLHLKATAKSGYFRQLAKLR